MKSHPAHQVNVLVHLLCNVTYATAFNHGSDLVVTPAKSMILYYMTKTIPNI